MRRKRNQHRTRTRPPKSVAERQPFSEHLQELRTRLLYSVGAVLIFATAAYFVQQQIVHYLLKPAHNQHFIYTSPAGGIGFLFQICTDVGIVLALPVIFYQVLSFLKPLIASHVRRFVVRCAFVSAGLALLGLGFGYFMGLPLALHFLGHQFSTSQIQPLLTVSEYMSFVTIYLLGSALLFQVPLLLVIINRIKPQPPRRLLRFERYVIGGAFIVSMLMAPTVNIVDQLVIAGPLIAAYQVGIGAVWLTNRQSRNQRQVARLLEQDRQAQAQRQARPQPTMSATSQPRPVVSLPSRSVRAIRSFDIEAPQ